jgi:LmbE family N-acetylglucosaminyl deacetylase
MPSLSVSAQTRLLVVAPHPDDETLGCGLLIQQVLAAGGEVRVVLLTDGDNNPWPQRYIERRLRIDTASRRRWGARRRSEVLRAMTELGLPASALQPMGWLDMEVTSQLRDDTQGVIAAMHAAVDTFQPSLICFPALGDSHPDHGAAHVLCRLALDGAGQGPELLAYPVHGEVGAQDYPIGVDATAGQQERKLQAMTRHQTQMVLSGRRMRSLALSPERYKPVDRSEKDARLPWEPPAFLRPWLRLLVVTPAGARDLRWSEAPIVPDAQGGYRWQSSDALSGPVFVKLHLDWPSPWIFDHWGWHAV